MDSFGLHIHKIYTDSYTDFWIQRFILVNKGNEKHIKIGTMDNIKVQASMFAETPGVQD